MLHIQTSDFEKWQESQVELTETLTQIFLKDIHVSRTFIWLVGGGVGLLIQPACRPRTDVRAAKPAAPQALVCSRKNPQTRCCYLVSHPPADLQRWFMLQWPSHDLKLGFVIMCRQSYLMMEWRWDGTETLAKVSSVGLLSLPCFWQAVFSLGGLK